jgi:hypothetical protein
VRFPPLTACSELAEKVALTTGVLNCTSDQFKQVGDAADLFEQVALLEYELQTRNIDCLTVVDVFGKDAEHRLIGSEVEVIGPEQLVFIT